MTLREDPPLGEVIDGHGLRGGTAVDRVYDGVLQVADLATNIREDAVYLAEGKQIKHNFEERQLNASKVATKLPTRPSSS